MNNRDGMASERAVDAFLEHLKRRTGNSADKVPAAGEIDRVTRQLSSTQDLVSTFRAGVSAAGCTVHDTPRAEVVERIGEVLRSADVSGAHLSPTCRDVVDSEQLARELHTVGVDVRQVAAHELFDIQAAVVAPAAAIAETGSLVVESSDATRGETLYPDLLLALVPRDRILADVADVYARYAPNSSAAPRDLPASILLITGPSKTADIEGTLVTGVHGPGNVHVLLLRD